MKIAYIYTALTSVGGVDRVVSTKANYLADNLGYEVYIITDSQAGRQPVFPLSAKVKHIDLETDFDEQYHYGIIRRALCYFRLMRLYKRRLKKVLFDIRPDIVLTTCGRDLDFLNSIKDGSLKIGESHTIKQACRNFHLMEERGFPYRQIARFWRRKQENAIKKLDALVVLTERDAEDWRSVRDAVVIPNSLPFYPIESSTLKNKIAISAGRLCREKAFDKLINAWKNIATKHPDWTLNIYGEGMLHDDLKRQITTMNLDHCIHLCGPVNNIMDKYLESSIYVMSSQFEGFGMVLSEAMACGVPCISFDCPYGPANIIKNKEDGILVENGREDKLSESICRLIEDEPLRKSLGERAKLNIKRLSPDIIMRQWDELFKTLTNK